MRDVTCVTPYSDWYMFQANLLATDEVLYYYQLTTDPKDELKNVLESQKAVLQKSLKQDLIEGKPEKGVIIDEEQEVCCCFQYCFS